MELCLPILSVMRGIMKYSTFIDCFINQYNKEYDFYQKLSTIVSNKIENQLSLRGIKAIVTHRAKKPESLKEKIISRNEKKAYESTDDIRNDIVDLSGVRIALYFPSERNIIDEIIKDLFVVDGDKIKNFPEKDHKPKYEKRFSGYWATHYRVHLKKEDAIKRYSEITTEIQVASVLMHAWSEVEHDLVYKPYAGNLSKEEMAILDEINGLVMSGEIALERLNSAMAERTKKQSSINNIYDLTNLLLNHWGSESKIKFGNTSILNNYLNSINKVNIKSFNKYIKSVDTNLDEPIADQILNMLLSDNDVVKLDLKNYFKNLNIQKPKISGFESFVKCWIILEKAMKSIYKEDRRQGIPNFQFLVRDKILTNKDISMLNNVRSIRNSLLHGIETPSDEHLLEMFGVLQQVTSKVIEEVSDASDKEALMGELEQLEKWANSSQ
jgi:ppGpp synthetase/RelA/SpoT-type nucleotidyltranferase